MQDDAASQRQIDAVVLVQHELRAPFDAKVIARSKELGGIVNAGEAVFTLIAPDSIPICGDGGIFECALPWLMERQRARRAHLRDCDAVMRCRP